MQGIKPQIMEMAGFVVQPIDLAMTFGNVLTAITTCNHRPSMLPPFTTTALESWRSAAVAATKADDVTEMAKQLTAARGGDALRSPLALFLKHYEDVAATLISAPVYVADIGAEVADTLLRDGSWSKQWVSSPSLGYAREYISPSAGIPAFRPTGLPNWEDDVADVEGAQSARSMMATLAMVFDRPMLTDRLIPDAKTLTTRDNREPWWGTTKSAMAQADRLTAVGLLYERQLDAFWMHFTTPFITMAASLARAAYPREAPILDFKLRLIEEMKRQLPCHPLLRSIAEMYSKVTVSTYYGDKQLVYRHGPAEYTPSSNSTERSRGRSQLAQIIIAEAIADAARLRALAVDNAWPGELLRDIAPGVKPGVTAAILSASGAHYGLAEWLHDYRRYVAHWPELVRVLGWGSGVSAQAFHVDQSCADFLLTDGDYYSGNPSAALAGVRPTLSLGNVKASGFTRRFQADFNTGPVPGTAAMPTDGTDTPVSMMWSTLTAKGHMAAVGGPLALTRFFIPTGMSMGETGAEVRFYDGRVADPVGDAVLAVYRQASSKGYVTHWYADPVSRTSRQLANGSYLRTDWDTWTHAGQPTAAQELLLAGYGAQNVDVSPVNQYLYRESGWPLRFPVAIATIGDFEWYDEMGELRDMLKRDGHVLFDDQLTLPDSYGSIDAYVNLLVPQAPALPTAIDEEVKKPVAS